MVAIVAVGYSRPDGIKRLLLSLSQAEYEDDHVDLIISIDKGQKQAEVIRVAENFSWRYGEKVIRTFSERQGLRSHIMQCGSLTDNYDAVILIEDDIIVSKDFYRYTKAALQFYQDDKHIAGISLYKHSNNVETHRSFDATENGSDAFLIQYAQSWGQCWSKRMWHEFFTWYQTLEDDRIFDSKQLPQYLKSWKASWLKYNIAYCILHNKYFVYPYRSLSTNCSDLGEHSNGSNSNYQVPILRGAKEYCFAEFDRCVRYDGFFERMDIIDVLEVRYGASVVIDLYGSKHEFGDAKYLFSTATKPYKLVDSIKLVFRPHEENLLEAIKGDGIFVYDLYVPAPVPKKNSLLLAQYDLRDYPFRYAIMLDLIKCFQWLKSGIKARLIRLLKGVTKPE